MLGPGPFCAAAALALFEPVEAVVVAHAPDDVGQAVPGQVARRGSGCPWGPAVQAAWKSACHVQESDPGLRGTLRNQPLGVRRSTRPSPLTSPDPTPCPAALVPKLCFFHSGRGPCSSPARTRRRRWSRWAGRPSLPSPFRSTMVAASLVPGQVNLVIGPRLARLAGVLDPADVPREVAAGDEVGLAVAVDVHRQRGEVVVIGPLPDDVADVRGGPVGGAVPRVARDDVELAVAVDIEDARGLELALAVDRVLLPSRLAGVPATTARPARENGQRRGGHGRGGVANFITRSPRNDKGSGRGSTDSPGRMHVWSGDFTLRRRPHPRSLPRRGGLPSRAPERRPRPPWWRATGPGR